MSPQISDTAEGIPTRPETPDAIPSTLRPAPRPIAAALATPVGIAGAVAVVVLHGAVGDVVGVTTMACGLAATVWTALRLAGDSDPSD